MNPAHPLRTGTPYAGYTYAYPHKTAYRPIEPALPLADVWSAETRRPLFFYIHVPFCEMRCGFCNLFTLAKPRGDLVERFLKALKIQAEVHREALGDAPIRRFAIGGGTPTFLDEAQLERVFDIAERFAGPLAALPSSVETSPGTATEGRLRILHERGIRRVSIGVQSFTEAEVRAAARPQQNAEVHAALMRMRSFGFPILNIDLIYGLPEQTVASWLASVRSALRYQPEEIFLYPLYVRPLTGLGLSNRAWDDQRLECYREARNLLLSEGYQQLSMRLFRARHAPAEDEADYCVQSDDMVGLGSGARSYARGVHFSQGYAVRQKEVAAIIDRYAGCTADDFARVDFGFRMSPAERQRRYGLLALLQHTGIDAEAFEAEFGLPLRWALPELQDLIELDLAHWQETTFRLTARGMEYSDAIGPWLYSADVRGRMEAYEWH